MEVLLCPRLYFPENNSSVSKIVSYFNNQIIVDLSISCFSPQSKSNVGLDA